MNEVTFIANNIPLPGHKENDIIIKLGRELSNYYSINFIFPCEYIPQIPFLRSKASAISRLKRHFVSGNISIQVFKYLRLPTIELSYLLADSFLLFNRNRFGLCKSSKLIHAHYIMPDGYLAQLISKRYGIPYIISARQGDLNKISRLRSGFVFEKYKSVLDNASRILTVNHGDKADLEKLGFDVSVVPHGIEETYISDKIEPHTDDTVRIITVTKLEPNKRIDWCIKAINEYPGRKRIEYTIIGSGSQEKTLKNLVVNKPNISINFTGYKRREEIKTYYSHSDIFIQPSMRETFGLVYLEAIANGCATIAMKNTGISGFFKENEEVLYSDHDFEQFKSLLYKLIDNDNLREKIRKNGLKKVKDQFTQKSILNRYRNIYDSIINGANHIK